MHGGRCKAVATVWKRRRALLARRQCMQLAQRGAGRGARCLDKGGRRRTGRGAVSRGCHRGTGTGVLDNGWGLCEWRHGNGRPTVRGGGVCVRGVEPHSPADMNGAPLPPVGYEWWGHGLGLPEVRGVHVRFLLRPSIMGSRRGG